MLILTSNRALNARRLRNGLALRDVVVLMGCVVLLGVMGMVAQVNVSEKASRVRCMSNLRQFSLAMMMYANDNRGWYPITAYAKGDNPVPTFGTPYEADAKLDALEGDKPADPFSAKEKDPILKYLPAPNDVTAVLYRLVSQKYLTTPEVFVCPSTTQEPWDFEGGGKTARHWTNFRGIAGIKAHLSYSVQNPYASNAAVAKGFKFKANAGADFVIVGDMNPGTAAVMTITPQSPAKDMREGNSINHAREGQNFAYADGHVQFMTSPFAGIKLDNVYTFGASGEGIAAGGEGISGSPTGPADSVLLPTSKDIGLVDAQDKASPDAAWAPADGKEIDAINKKLAGTFAGKLKDGTEVEIAINKVTFKVTGGGAENSFIYLLTGVAADKVALNITPGNTRVVIRATDTEIAVMSGKWAGTYQRK